MNTNGHGHIGNARIGIFMLALLLALPAPAFSATIVLKTGKKISTHRYVEKDGAIEFDYDGLITQITRDKVERIESDSGEVLTGTGTAPSAASASGGREDDPDRDKPPKVAWENAPGPVPKTGDPEEEAAGKDTAYLSRIISAISSYKRHVGFREIFWGCQTTDIYGLEPVGRDPILGGVDEYVRYKEKLAFGDATLEKIVYGFWRNKLISITLWADGEKGYQSMRDEVFNRFGQGIQREPGVERRIWIGGASSKYLEFDPSTGKGLFWFRNQELWQRASALYRPPAEPAALGK